MSWLEAVKAHSKKTGKWLVPKKGTAEYEAVKKIQAEIERKAAEPVPEPVKKPKMTAAEARAKKAAEMAAAAAPVPAAKPKAVKKTVSVVEPVLPVPAPIKLTKSQELVKLREETAKLKAELEAKNAVSFPVAKRGRKALKDEPLPELKAPITIDFS